MTRPPGNRAPPSNSAPFGAEAGDRDQRHQDGWGELRRVGIIRTGALGDLIVSLAALAEMKSRFPKARVTVFGSRLWTEMLDPAAWPEIEEVVVLTKKIQTTEVYTRAPSGRWEKSGTRRLSEAFAALDGIVNLNIDSYRYGFAALRAGVRVRIGSTPASMAWLYTHASPWFGKDPVVHERDAALLVLGEADGSWKRLLRSTSGNRARLAATQMASPLVQKWQKLGLPRAKIPNLVEAERLAGQPPKTFVLINPTSSRRTNVWPSERFHEFAMRARARLKALGLEVLILGAPNETEWLKEVARTDFRIVQPPRICALQDVLSASRALLTNTSSLQFLAATTQTPTLTLMGRANPAIWGPLGPLDRAVRGQPPRELDGQIFAQEQAAYESLSVERVSAEFFDWLEHLPPP